jgi:hypothetical protein
VRVVLFYLDSHSARDYNGGTIKHASLQEGDKEPMDPTTIAQYAGFVVAALILIWGVMVLSRRYYGKRRKINTEAALTTWVRLDSPRAEALEEEPSSRNEENLEESSEENPYTRAQQNGHYSESKKML